MKRIFYFAMAAVLCLAACQKADQLEQVGNKSEVTFAVSLPGSIETRSISDGLKAMKLFYATYTDEGKMIASLSNITEGVAVTQKTATVTLQLVKELNYDVVFWAQSPDCKAFTFDWETAKMTVDYNGAANDDLRDAFYAVRQNLKVTDGVLRETVYLYRPFAQINFGAADYQSVVDYYDQTSVDAGMKSSLVIAEVPNTLDLLDESLEDATAPANFTLEVIPSDPRLLTVNGIDYKYVSMNYVLAPKGSQPDAFGEITANFYYEAGNIDRTIKVPSVPYQRNHRTNILGNFFTETAIINIIIDEEFDKPDHNIYDRYESEVPSGNVALDGTVMCIEGVNSTETLKLSGKGTVVLSDVVIDAASGNAVELAAGAEVVLEVQGDVTLDGAEDGNGIEVPAGAKLTVTGAGKLTVTGNNGADGDYDTVKGGSAIGNASDETGEIIIDGVEGLEAKGYGKHGYGIGGIGAKVSVIDSHIADVAGGFVQPEFIKDLSYGKTEQEGGSAIGGSEILIEGSVVDMANGGSKAAAIGTEYWQNTNITIINSTIGQANGGNASAGIGGSRYAGGISESDKQEVYIRIEDSKVTAKGGQFAAGIGAGYDTHTSANATNAVNDIQIINSTVKASGGKYGAGIGTGYHSAALTGSIDAVSAIDATAGESREKYTIAQSVGYGVVDPAREFAGAVITFTVAGNVIAAPTVQ